MNILFLSCAYSETQKEEFQTKSKRGYQYAAQNFQEAMFDGFLNISEVNLNVLSIPSLSTFPKGCSMIWIKDDSFVFRGNKIGEAFGYANLPFCNHYSQSRIDHYIDKWYEGLSEDKCIIVYAMLKKQMQYAVAAKKRHPDIKLCLIVPDLPMYMNCNKYYKMLGLQKHDMTIINTLLHSFDCYVVLTEPMIEQLKIAEKPYVVVEGIYNNITTALDSVEKLPNITILYAGGIQTRYGVFDLIEAFHRIEKDNYKLILCGPCLEMDKLNHYTSTDSRIEYRGLIPTDEVRILQKKVTVLVNPRHSTEEFTKYSFPSKTLEYMASGTPVLMCPLPSMPKEYKPYLYLFKDESIEGMSQMIEYVLSFKSSELISKGNAAKDFIRKNKNAEIQTKKILQLIKGLSGNAQ